MIEPDDHTAWVDRFGDTWVRADNMPGTYGSWWPLTDGPGWEPQARNDIGKARGWDGVREYGPFERADADRTAGALDRVRRQVTS